MQDVYILTSRQPFKRERFVRSGFCGRKVTSEEEALAFVDLKQH